MAGCRGGWRPSQRGCRRVLPWLVVRLEGADAERDAPRLPVVRAGHTDLLHEQGLVDPLAVRVGAEDADAVTDLRFSAASATFATSVFSCNERMRANGSLNFATLAVAIANASASLRIGRSGNASLCSS